MRHGRGTNRPLTLEVLRVCTTRSLTAVAAAAGLSAALIAAPATAVGKPHGPDRIDLAPRSLPEGIAAGPDGTFFAGARSDGAIYVADVATGERRELVEGQEDAIAVGLLYDAVTDRLYVSGGTTGDVTVYSGGGEPLFTANAGPDRFINDVAFTQDAAYFTDSRAAELIVVPFNDDGSLPEDGTFEVLQLSDAYVQPVGDNAFGLNGIRVLPNGELVAVSAGVLYSIDPETGAADVIEVRGRQLAGGDGLVLDGSTLYVVNGYGGDEVAVLRLRDGGTGAQAVGVIKAEDLDRPTTGAIVDGALYVVNGRFSVADDPDTEFYVTKLRLR